MRYLPAALLLSTAPAFVAGILVGRSVARAGDDLLTVGSVAPDLEGKDATGAPVKLSSQKGRFAVVYFYPKDDTPGCTKEACAFRDSFDKFGKAGVTIFGVSRDDEASHKAFRDKYKLPFVLVADGSKAAQHAYHVPGLLVASRVSFLVGPDGKIARVWPKVDPVVHASEVLGAVTALDPKRAAH
jgi:peroxiredoxin Q/BCP